MDGDSIMKLNLQTQDDKLHFKNSSFLLNIDNTKNTYGRKMDVYIADTLYFGEKSVSNGILCHSKFCTIFVRISI